MATQRPAVSVASTFVQLLLREREIGARALLIVQQAAELLPGTCVVLYLEAGEEHGRWSPKAMLGELRLDEAEIANSPTFAAIVEQRTPMLTHGSDLAREDYPHLQLRRTLKSLAYLPVFYEETMLAILEIIALEEQITEAQLATLGELLACAGPALASAIAYEDERNSNLESISRLTQFYDLEKVFGSTLEMETLLPIITAKLRELLSVQAVNLWMVADENQLVLASRAGEDATFEEGAILPAGQGIAGQVSESGETLLIEDASHELLQARNGELEEGRIASLMAAPLVVQEKEVGVVEAINKFDGTPFDEDDLFLLSSVTEATANSLNNASLLQTERKVQVLETLVKVSGEITSTLNIDRVLQTVVNGTGAVIPYERAAIALEQRGRLQLKAVSGLEQINPDDADVKRLRELLQWAYMLEGELLVSQKDEEVAADREETRAKMRAYFEQSGMRGFYGVPLYDQEGKLGILSFESSDPDFLSEAHFEMIKIVASQATVALRNAALYKEVPFINVLEPLLQKKQKFMAAPARQRATWAAAAAGVVLLLVAVPFPMRLEGGAQVASAQTAQVQTEIPGAVKRVYVHEGDLVQKGSVLADLDDWDYRAALSAAEAKYETASAEANKALAGNDGGEAGIQRVQAAYWASEVQRAGDRLERTHLRSPITGRVTTAHVEDLTGRYLAPGDSFAQVVDDSTALIDVAVDESDAPLLRPAASASVKLEAYPARTFKGQVAVISPIAQAQEDGRVFIARVLVANPGDLMRPGMQGRGKIYAGWHPIGYVFLRGPAAWLYSKLWSWLGW
jgi:RND family efflux transporter MFP subunit